MRKLGAQKAAPQMGRMGAEDPASLPGGPHIRRWGTGGRCAGESAVGGSAEDDLAVHRRGKRCFTASLDERQDAAPEARAHDACAEAAFGPPRLLDQRVYGRRRHLEVVTQALMRFLEQHAQSFEAALFEGIDESMDASDLRVEVAPPFRVARLRFASPLVVRRIRKRTMLARINDRDHKLVGERHGLLFGWRAVEQQRVPAAAESGSELVHHAYMHARGPLLGTLACEARLNSANLRAQP